MSGAPVLKLNDLMLNRAGLVAVILSVSFAAVEAGAAQRIQAEEYAVVSGHPEATAVGMQVLRDGGNVVDAAIATSLALGVAEPYGSGLGGKLIMLYRDAATGDVHSIVALCTSPGALDENEFVSLPSNQRKYGYRSVGVPGLLAGLYEAHECWGSKPWQDLVEPAAELAERGVKINHTMRRMFLPKVKFLRQDDEAARIYLIDNEAPQAGTVIFNADLAASLHEIASGGAKAFYEGPIAEKIVSASQANGGSLSMDDFRGYRVEVGRPIQSVYRGIEIYSCPPPLTGGITVLSALGCLEKMDPTASNRGLVRFTDDLCRSLQCLYPQIRDQVADVPTARDSAQALMSSSWATRITRRAHHLNPRDPQQDRSRRPSVESTLEGLPAASTSHLIVVDHAGNMVSLTQSLSLHFGASVVAPGTGILLNDSMSNFATHSPEAVNYVAAEKRARSTIAPIIATKSGKPWLALGIPGGQRIPTTTIQLLWRLVDLGESPDEAFAASRFHLRRPLRFDAPENVVDHEADAPSYWKEQMRSRGWKLVSRPRDGHYFGGGGAAQYSDDGHIVAVADPRRTNSAAGE